jgi:cystathionine gamma-synthase
MDPRRPPPRPETRAVSAGRGDRRAGAPLNVPVTLASVYHSGTVREYGREGNPTWTAFEEALGALEGGHALAFGSGMAAIGAVLDLVPLGAVVVAPTDAYSGTRARLSDLEERGRATPRYVDIADTDATLAACDGATLLWAESPTNPLLAVADLERLLPAARDRGLRTVVDNTFATPLRQRPLDLGADIVVHSATKFLAGHSDLLLGATVTADGGLCGQLSERRRLLGAVPGPLDAWLALRGVRTLPVRLDRSEDNARELAERLGRHERVARVRYPGFGAMLSFEVAGGASAADAVCGEVRVCTHATSLGGVETTLERRAVQPGEEAIPPGLIRVSVGCEHIEDLWADLDAALAGGGPGSP